MNKVKEISLNATVTSLDIHENFLLVTSSDRKIRIYDMVSEKLLQEIEGHTLAVNQGL